MPERARVYAHGRRHSLAHLYAARIPQYGSSAGRAGWLVTSPRLRNPAGRAGAPCGERIGWIEAWAGPYRPTCTREKKKEGQ